MMEMSDKLKELLDKLKTTNAETYYHSIRVKTLTIKMITLMNKSGYTDYSTQKICCICKGALLHDIGKLYVKNAILTKDSGLSEAEKKHMNLHTKLSYKAIEKELKEDEIKVIRNICLYHHERIDGSGYDGKTKLPKYVQAVAVCDVFDALTSDRIYRNKLSYNEALDIIQKGKSGYFSEEMIHFLKLATADYEE